MKTVQEAVNEVVMMPKGSQIDLHCPSGFWMIRHELDGTITSQNRNHYGKLHPKNRETPQFAMVGK